ncbi:RdgB/HAM1 family non-canonical purine NTP pyrophosphatase [Flavisolibacter tropicus]|uniref:dITP/XTP pyrophosphatase n=1 Tax=Flavisolibacter tropicus TaxID=1492898 RepID=A0A172TTG7_9BACT|nr:RdgB/HAM1 family non-canonical purine NTP pyrophosphatase [Flavisolibacter tropicus]ANE50164.1 deoxyribonucleotide triphosphate pyrophosphatase [Flavisolibacter tropicus]
MKLIFATNNQHKVEEIRAVLPKQLSIITLKEAGIDKDIPEPHPTLEENAQEKATVIYKMTSTNCFSEDSGLEIRALNGEPGVKSARYAGDDKSSADNIKKVLTQLQDQANREAQFRTVICLVWNGEEHFFEGICKGQVIQEEIGSQGFGYDPIFIPDGAQKTFAQMTMEEKNQYSHRRKAVGKLVAFLNDVAVK